MDYQESVRQYQNALEYHRRDPDDEIGWEELVAAREQMEILWLAAITGIA